MKGGGSLDRIARSNFACGKHHNVEFVGRVIMFSSNLKDEALVPDAARGPVLCAVLDHGPLWSTVTIYRRSFSLHT